MEKVKIINMLKECGVEDVKEIEYKDDMFVLNFFYDFDEDEVNAARAYAKDESGEKEENEVWYEEFFLPYLSDLSIDNVGEVIEDIMEESNIEAQFMCYDLDAEEFERNEFIAIFYPKNKEIIIEDILDDLDL